MQTIRFMFTFVLINLGYQSFAEEKGAILEGRVTDADNEGIPFATISVKNTFEGTVCNEKGEFSLVLSDTDECIIIARSVGYEEVHTRISPLANTHTNITLQSIATQIKEVSVTALGVKEELARNGFSMEVLETKDLKQQPSNVNMVLKTLLRKIHLYGGLASGLVVFIVSITGAIYAFKAEIESVTDSFKYVEAQDKEVLLPSQAFEIASKEIPNTQIHGVAYHGEGHAIEVIFYQPEPFYYGITYLNPYSGEVLKNRNNLRNFFELMQIGHTSLFLPKSIGLPIIKVTIIIYFIMLITGLVMWWPGNWRRKGAFYFSKSNKAIVKVKEWHQILAFYSISFILIILLTGSVFIFKSLENGIYYSLGGEKETTFSYPESDISQKNALYAGRNAVDLAYKKIRNEVGPETFVEIHEIHDSISSILVEVNHEPATWWKMDYIFYDQYTLKELTPKHAYGRFEMASTADKVRRLNYDIHSGGIGGFLGKLLAFLVSLISASLPVTGTWYWLKRRKIKKQSTQLFSAQL